ncbi:NAD(P)/FAD-dependent oxidoreductase [Granulibacter bethesdensis]|uniref:NADH dehydrogenase n=1 Tax=Granulibacter bethesdensis (strain ATCC BAA-1260 / CGDNIH1) TaxID=391165 RepID=Q0BRK2_GRABC|nr:NAD(P)/FAD-dependent oxidoreductase [Granulibacter bethesdensis]ABI62550.1 NADH dehydrogenase [Granulibacter bethesdensis CGDNIH1]APH52399.1 NADH dehydrogenase [Granulibacter bethesdensis]APH65089.1 NADH dehydrogenase [Granulibacter bethesdensis]
MNQAHRIVVVGGGAGGLELVTALGNTLGKHGKAHVTLIDRARAHVWKPLLHIIAAGSMDPGEHQVNYLAQAKWNHFDFRLGEMIGLDRQAQLVHLGEMRDEEGRQITAPRSIPYDTLVICLGSVTNDFGTPGAAQYAVPLDTPTEAVRFNRRLLNACIRAQSQDGPRHPGQLHVAIIGAGATGSELAAELHRTARQMVAYGLDRIDPQRDMRIMLIEAASRILPALPERMSVATEELLKELGVEVMTNCRVAEVREDGVQLSSGTFLPAELVVWSAGVKAPDFLRDIDGLETNRANQLVVEQTLQTTRDPNIFAFGDCAACPLDETGRLVPPRAQAAHQQASHMVGQIKRRMAGEALKPYHYRDFGSLVSLGRYSTVGNLMGSLVGKNMFIEGYFARLMYRSLYKMHEVAVSGWWRTMVDTLARSLSSRVEPTVKLH